MKIITDNKYLAPLVLVDSTATTIAALLFFLHFSVRSLPDMGSLIFFPSGDPYFFNLFLSASFFLCLINQSGTSAGIGFDGSAIYNGLIPFFSAFASPDKYRTP